MKTHEFINQEFKKTVLDELNKLSDKIAIHEIKETISSFTIREDFENIDSLFELFSKNEVLVKLKFSNFILEQLKRIDELEFSSDVLKSIAKILKSKPKHKLLSIIWVYQQLNIFKEDEFFEIEVAQFFETLFNNCDYLINLEDFFEETSIKYEILYNERLRNSYQLLIPVFNEAITNHPTNYYLKKILGFLYYFQGDYEKSLEILNSLIVSIDAVPLLSDGLEYLEIMEYLALNYDKLGDDNKALECVEYVLSNLPIGIFENEEEELTSYAIDSFFLRMRQNMKQGNKQQVLEDYNRVKEDLYWWEGETDYPDVMEYILQGNK